MIEYAYEKISKIVKEVRGFTLADNPSNFQEIMKAYDNIQHIKANGVQMVMQLLKDTELWIGILSNNAGTQRPKYLVASNEIARTCIDIIHYTVESTSDKAAEIDLQPQLSPDLSLRVNELLNVIMQVERLCVVPETHKVYSNLVKKLLIVQEQVEAFVFSN